MATSDFGKAFRAARKSGKKTFKWNGKLYTTELREEKQPKNVPVPAKRPDGRTAQVAAKATSKSAPKTVPTPEKRPDTKAAPTEKKPANAGIVGKYDRPKTPAAADKKPANSDIAGKYDRPKTPAKPAEKKDEPIDPNKYKGTPQAERDRGDLSGPRMPPAKSTTKSTSLGEDIKGLVTSGLRLATAETRSKLFDRTATDGHEARVLSKIGEAVKRKEYPKGALTMSELEKKRKAKQLAAK